MTFPRLQHDNKNSKRKRIVLPSMLDSNESVLLSNQWVLLLIAVSIDEFSLIIDSILVTIRIQWKR